MRRWKQTAEGTTDIIVVPHTPHCGPDNSTVQHIAYRIAIRYLPDPLDCHGFLLDNTAFSAYFANLQNTPVSVSCELLCERIARELWESRMEHIEVSLSAISGVWVSVALEYEDMEHSR